MAVFEGRSLPRKSEKSVKISKKTESCRFYLRNNSSFRRNRRFRLGIRRRIVVGGVVIDKNGGLKSSGPKFLPSGPQPTSMISLYCPCGSTGLYQQFLVITGIS